MTRVLAIGLDGYEEALFSSMMDAGELPALQRLRSESARLALDHGVAQRSGLGWEQLATGLSPDDSGRHTAVYFDKAHYRANHESARYAPFAGQLDAKTVVFDVPYFDLGRAPGVGGLVNWGAHDPGIPPMSNPPGLFSELEGRFGQYAEHEWTYGFVWPSPERAKIMGEALVRGVNQRCDAALWLLKDRLPDWDLALIVIGELHGACEALWHGIDPSHPLHDLPSAPAARQSLKDIIRAADRMVGRLCDAFPDATIVCFATHGMGSNHSDVPSMVLLPELLYRAETGKQLLRGLPDGHDPVEGVPMLRDGETWKPDLSQPVSYYAMQATRAAARTVLPASLKRLISRSRERLAGKLGASAGRPLDWHASSRYIPYWPGMRAFALPSFYDGRVRINLEGREARGLVAPNEYESEVEKVRRVVEACTDPATGKPVVREVEFTAHLDPCELDPTEADITFVWDGAPLAFEHPELGTLGPLPYRRTGGHTGGHGFAYLRGAQIQAGDFGVRSVFDVVPSLIDLLGESLPAGLSGESFAPLVRLPAAA